MLRPLETMVASCRDMTASSRPFTGVRRSNSSSTLGAALFSSRSSTTSPRRRNCAATAALESAESSPELVRAAAVAGAIGVGERAHDATLTRPSRRASSSSLLARSPASLWVIMPARTRAASEASSDCMPNWEPVWMAE